MAKRTTADETAEIRQLVREAGLRCTASRVAVLRELRKSKSPVTHADVAENLADVGFDKATVYRNLIDLAEVGLASRTELGDHVWRFEARDPSKPEEAEHPHFVCIDCGSVTCLSDGGLNSTTRREAADIGQVTEILLKGRCKSCHT